MTLTTRLNKSKWSSSISTISRQRYYYLLKDNCAQIVGRCMQNGGRLIPHLDLVASRSCIVTFKYYFRFKLQKSIFILFQFVTIISFSAIYFVPHNRPKINVELNCGPAGTVLTSCYKDSPSLDCKIQATGDLNVTSTCKVSIILCLFININKF